MHYGQTGELNTHCRFEYGYSESSQKLALDAARHLLLSQGLVQLVVTINVKRKSDVQDGLMVLEKVTWAHWEVDRSSFEEVEFSWQGDVDDLQPDQDVNEDFVQPPADADKAVIEMGGKKYHLRAFKVNEWEVHRNSSDLHISLLIYCSQLYPKQTTNRLDVLYHHLYREPDKKDANHPAFSILTSHLMAVIEDHEWIQEDQERSKKRSTSEQGDIIAVKIERLKKRARRL